MRFVSGGHSQSVGVPFPLNLESISCAYLITQFSSNDVNAMLTSQVTNESLKGMFEVCLHTWFGCLRPHQKNSVNTYMVKSTQWTQLLNYLLVTAWNCKRWEGRSEIRPHDWNAGEVATYPPSARSTLECTKSTTPETTQNDYRLPSGRLTSVKSVGIKYTQKTEYIQDFQIADN